MKQSFIIFLLSLISLWSQAQPVSQFDRTDHDFGDILWKKAVSVHFRMTNKGTEPLIINFVETDCGCTVAEWAQTPIAPGKSGDIQVTFDAGLLGRFHKFVEVYSNIGDEPQYLTLTGRVVAELENYGETFPYEIGSVRTDRMEINFGDIHRGDHPTAELNLVNTGESEYAPTLLHLPPYITATATPDTLQRKQSGKILFTLNTEMLKHVGLQQTNIYLARYRGDKVSDENRIIVRSTLLPDFSNLTATQHKMAPSINLSETEIDFGSFGTKKKLNRTITITNTGRSVLRIESAQVSDIALGFNLKKSEIRPGESIKLKLTMNKGSKKPIEEPYLVLITNDPQKPKTTIRTRTNL